MKTTTASEKEALNGALAFARALKPAYESVYPLLEALFLLQIDIKGATLLDPLDVSPQHVRARWEGGFPLLRRWDFPLDIRSAGAIFEGMKQHLGANEELAAAHRALSTAFESHRGQESQIWQSFLQHDWEPWDEWVGSEGVDIASLLFLARSCLRPSIEKTAEDLLQRFPLPRSWLKGYCPVCGSLPSLLFLQNEGERGACCSWCGTEWELYRLQCPSCDNRAHESLGYIYIEEEPDHRVQYCQLCKAYFKQIDLRDRADPPFFPLEEWTTLHLDLLAQRAGWVQPPSPSRAVYGDTPAEDKRPDSRK